MPAMKAFAPERQLHCKELSIGGKAFPGNRRSFCYPEIVFPLDFG